MGKYLIFKTESAAAPGWEKRSLAHTNALTTILAEHYDSSDLPLPQPGYRLREYQHLETSANPQFPAASTHSRMGDWQVTRVEVYTPAIAASEFDTIAVCYCKYVPTETPLEPLPEIQTS